MFFGISGLVIGNMGSGILLLCAGYAMLVERGWVVREEVLMLTAKAVCKKRSGMEG